MKKLVFRVSQGVANKSKMNTFADKVEDFQNLEDARELFEEIKHSKGWTNFYCYTTLEKLEIDDEEFEEEFVELIDEWYEEQR